MIDLGGFDSQYIQRERDLGLAMHEDGGVAEEQVLFALALLSALDEVEQRERRGEQTMLALPQTGPLLPSDREIPRDSAAVRFAERSTRRSPRAPGSQGPESDEMARQFLDSAVGERLWSRR